MADPYDDVDAAEEGLRVLVAAHSHPSVHNGGSEVASYALFEHLREQPGFAAWYLGCTRSPSYARAGQSITQPFADDDFLYTVGDFEGFKFANRDTAFPRDFRALLGGLRPQIVHLHHYVNFGMEAFLHVRRALPDARLVLTLHEFLGICHQQGQMVTRQEGALCPRSSPVACARCFPEVQPADFFLRQLYIEHFMAQVHHFVAPSRFLADRYIAWGIPAERITVIENVPRRLPAAIPPPRAGAVGLRVGFFGQISELKGIFVLLDAAEILEREGNVEVSFSIHGDHSNQPPAFQTAFLQRTTRTGSNVSFQGAYANQSVDPLMQAVDLVVVPSVWWENSPVVIQEAFRNARPVLCSDIGGMAEKVVAGETGAHFRVGDPRSLADALVGLAADPERLARLGHAARATRDETGPLLAHLALYRRLLAMETLPPPPVEQGASSSAPAYRPAPRFGHS